LDEFSIEFSLPNKKTSSPLELKETGKILPATIIRIYNEMREITSIKNIIEVYNVFYIKFEKDAYSISKP
jgi:hypothetical protein